MEVVTRSLNFPLNTLPLYNKKTVIILLKEQVKFRKEFIPQKSSQAKQIKSQYISKTLHQHIYFTSPLFEISEGVSLRPSQHILAVINPTHNPTKEYRYSRYYK